MKNSGKYDIGRSMQIQNNIRDRTLISLLDNLQSVNMSSM